MIEGLIFFTMDEIHDPSSPSSLFINELHRLFVVPIGTYKMYYKEINASLRGLCNISNLGFSFGVNFIKFLCQ